MVRESPQISIELHFYLEQNFKVTLELRLYAMFNKSRKVLISLIMVTVTVAASLLGILIKILTTEKGTRRKNSGLWTHVESRDQQSTIR